MKNIAKPRERIIPQESVYVVVYLDCIVSKCDITDG